MFDKSKEQFELFLKNYDMTIPNAKKKYNHTFEVVKLMDLLARRLGLNNEQIELAKVIGLLHDLGRFEELKVRDGKFDDCNFDHANWATIYLFEIGHIRDFIKDNKYDSIIKCAIYNHNKLTIERNLSKEELLFSKMLKDADKIDIFRVMALNSKNIFSTEVNPSALEDFKNKKLIKNTDIKYPSDNTLKILAFLFDINFEESFDILMETDNFDLFVGCVEVASDSEKLWQKVREICYLKIQDGIKERNI